MDRIRGRYRNQKVELEQPLDLPDGTEVEVAIRPVPLEAADDLGEWRELGMERLQEEWDNSSDAVYDNWRRLYGA